jgi:type IV fimbrial biogenesis protein FimT
MLTDNYRHAGFSLVELLIGVAVLGILISTAVPAYQVWIANTQIRNAADSIQNGLQLARMEALKRNQIVEFVLTNDSPTQDNVDSINASATGANWVVRVFQATGAYSNSDFIQGKGGADGSASTQLSVAPGGQNTIRFSSLGQASFLVGTSAKVPAKGGVLVEIASTTSANSSNKIRPLSVGISTGGQIRMCDPSVTSSTDPRHCPDFKN